jgi:sugar lactone lactonase YvrE
MPTMCRRPSRWYLTLLGVSVLALLATREAAHADNVVVPGSTDFPESMTGTADGTLIFSSFAGGRIFRAAPGAAEAKEWIKPGSNGLANVLGVLADEKTGTLYACSPNLSAAGVAVPGGGMGNVLAMFDLKTGDAKGNIPLPGTPTLCNDIAVGAEGSVYVTDSFAGHILRLKPGAMAFEVWAHDPRWDVPGKAQLDGIAVLPDGNVYANIFEGDGLYRIKVNPDGSAGPITKLATSRPLYHSDGMRAFGPDRLIEVEGETKGNLDLITINGDTAKIETIRSGFEGPVSLWQVGQTIYVLDVPLSFLLDPKKKNEKPPPFTAFAVPAPH